MANQTRGQILTRLYQYLPPMNQAAKTQLVNDAIDFAVEEMSRRHDFRSLRATVPDTCTMTAGQYKVDLTAFPVMGAPTTNLKDIIHLVWMLPGSNVDYWTVKFLDDKQFYMQYGYFDDPLATQGKPSEYTRLQDTFIFNCPADETIVLRAFYGQRHPKFASDNTSHQFNSRDDMLAAQTILYGALAELKSSLVGVEFPQELQTPASIFEMYLKKLIESDRDDPNETIDINWSERADVGMQDLNPYGWASLDRDYGSGGYGGGGYGS